MINKIIPARLNIIIYSFIIFIFLLVSCSKPLEFNGKLLIQMWGHKSKDDGSEVEFYDLNSGQKKLQKTTDPIFSKINISDYIFEISSDENYIVFYPNNLLNTKTGKKIKLPFSENKMKYPVEAPKFSPNSKYLAYLLSNPNVLVVYDIANNSAKKLFKTESAVYERQSPGKQTSISYAGLGSPDWLDDNTLIFCYHEGMSMSVSAYGDEIRSCNRIVIMNRFRKIILNSESPDGAYYDCKDKTVIRYIMDTSIHPRKYYIDGYMETDKLKKGIMNFHETPFLNVSLLDFQDNPSIYCLGSSHDGKLILTIRESDSSKRTVSIVELKTSKETPLDIQIGNEEILKFIWSHDNTMIAYLFRDYQESKLRLISIPLNRSFVFNWPDYKGRIRPLLWK